MKDVLIIHHNTPELTAACIRSLWKNTPDARVTLFDNSDRKPFDANKIKIDNAQTGCGAMLCITDNTHGQVVDWKTWLGQFSNKIPCGNDYGSAKHCYSVDVCMDRFPDGFVLMDSDVLVKRDITPLWNNRYAWIGSSHSNVLRKFGFNVWRVKPFICYINTPMLTKHGIRYFDPNRMWGLHNDGYDTGAVLYADCKKAGLPSLEVNIGEYIVHLRHASWCEKPADEWLEKYRNLWK